MNFKVTKDNVDHGSIDGILVQRGKTGIDPSNTLYWQSLNTDEIMQGVLPERMAIVTYSIKEMLANPSDGSERGKYSYKGPGYETVLRSKTLYIRVKAVEENLRKDLKKLYPYKYELVSDEQWAQALASKQEGVLVLEVIQGDRYSAIDIHDPEEGRIIVSAYPFVGTHHNVPKAYFKVFNK
jgi:hypothetical protein